MLTQLRPWLAGICASAFLASPALAQTPITNTFVFPIQPSQVVTNGPIQSTAYGVGLIELSGSNYSYMLSYFNITNSGTNAVTSITHNAGGLGIEGPSVFTLNFTNGNVVTGFVDNVPPVIQDAINSSNTYVRIGTSNYPDGELRGQVVPFPGIPPTTNSFVFTGSGSGTGVVEVTSSTNFVANITFNSPQEFTNLALFAGTEGDQGFRLADLLSSTNMLPSPITNLAFSAEPFVALHLAGGITYFALEGATGTLRGQIPVLLGTNGTGTGTGTTAGATTAGSTTSGDTTAGTGTGTAGDTTAGTTTAGTTTAGTTTAGATAGGTTAGTTTGGTTSGGTFQVLAWSIDIQKPPNTKKNGTVKPLKIRGSKGINGRVQGRVDYTGLPEGTTGVKVQLGFNIPIDPITNITVITNAGIVVTNITIITDGPIVWQDAEEVKPVNSRGSAVFKSARKFGPGSSVESGRPIDLWVRASLPTTTFEQASSPTNRTPYRVK